MRITIGGVECDWDEVDPDEALRHRHLQRQLAAFDQQVRADRQILLDQISDCVQRTRDKLQ